MTDAERRAETDAQQRCDWDGPHYCACHEELSAKEQEVARLRAALIAYKQFHEWHMTAPSEDIIDQIVDRRERLNALVDDALSGRGGA